MPPITFNVISGYLINTYRMFLGVIGFLFSIIVASAAIPTPGMAGTFDVASQSALEQLYGIDINVATAYTVLAHFLIIVNMIVPGLIALWSKGLSFSSIVPRNVT